MRHISRLLGLLGLAILPMIMLIVPQVAYAFDCNGPGVSVAVGHSTTVLKGDCKFQSAAIAALSSSQVEGTIRTLPMTCPLRQN